MKITLTAICLNHRPLMWSPSALRVIRFSRF